MSAAQIEQYADEQKLPRAVVRPVSGDLTARVMSRTFVDYTPWNRGAKHENGRQKRRGYFIFALPGVRA